MAMWAKWQSLSKSAETVAMIPNLIFTDNAASAVVGTKGILGPMNAAHSNVVPMKVTPMVQKIRYHLPFAIPAFILAFCLLTLSLAALILAILGNGTSKLSLHLRHLSPGRIFTSFLYPEADAFDMKSKDWSQRMGAKVVDFSRHGSVPPEGMTVNVNLPPKTDVIVTDSEQP